MSSLGLARQVNKCICVGRLESQAGQVGESVHDGQGQVQFGGDDGDGDGDKVQREPYCPEVSELTLPVYSNAGYKPRSSKHVDMQS